MSDRRRAAVVVVNYNNREYLGPCLESVRADMPDAELVVVDNASSDGSVEWMREHWPQATTLAQERNLGFTGGCNTGARAASAPVVIFLNNDATVRPGWGAALLDALAEPETKVAGGLALFAHDPGLVNSAGVRIGLSAAGTDIGFEQPLETVDLAPRDVAGVSGVSMAVDRAWFLDAGGFDDRFFMYFEDVDLCLRAWLEGWRVRFVPASVVDHAFGGTSGARYSTLRNYYASRNRMLTAHKCFDGPWVALALVMSVVQDIVAVATLVARRRFAFARSAVAGKTRGTGAAVAAMLSDGAPRRALRARRRRRVADLRRLGVIDPLGASLTEYVRFRRL